MDDVFKIFNLKPTFILDLSDLNETFLKIISEKKNEENFENFLKNLNYAYNIISSPIKRINELIKILNEEEFSKNYFNEIDEEEKISEIFLNEIFKLNCELEEINGFDEEILNEKISEFIEKILNVINSFSKDIQNAYEKKDIKKLKYYMNVLSFYNKIYSNAKEVLH